MQSIARGQWTVSVRACDGDNCGQGELTMFQVDSTPAKPSGLQATTEVGSLDVSLDWDDIEVADSYMVRWREDASGTQLNEGVIVTSSSASVPVATLRQVGGQGLCLCGR